MKYLLHCIFASGADLPPSVTPFGVSIVDAHALRAAISCLNESKLPLDVGRLLAYEKVVAAFHERQPVIPLRYGCTMENEAAIRRLLEENCEEYQRLLRHFEGMVEMGLRILVGNRQKPQASHSHGNAPTTPGAAYLASLRKQHAAETRLTEEEQALETEICTTLAGLYARQRGEASTIEGARLLSLFFLVPRTSVAWFAKRLEDFQSWRVAKFLLSGPWPPYNFV